MSFIKTTIDMGKPSVLRSFFRAGVRSASEREGVGLSEETGPIKSIKWTHGGRTTAKTAANVR